MKHISFRAGGFTLVEVALALGLAGFCLVSIFGLLTVGMNSTSSAIKQTTATNILNAVAVDLRSAPNPLPKGASQQFSSVYGIAIPPATPTSSSSQGQAPTPTQKDGVFVSESGQFLIAAKPGVPAPPAADYLISVWTTPATVQTTTGVNGVTLTPTYIRVMLSWPASASLQNAAGSVEAVIALDRN